MLHSRASTTVDQVLIFPSIFTTFVSQTIKLKALPISMEALSMGLICFQRVSN